MIRMFLFVMVCLVLMTTSCHRATREEQCLEMVRHEKRRLPRNVARGLVLDSIRYDTKTSFLVYYHTMNDSVYTDEMIDYGRDQLQQNLQQDIINSVALKRLKDEGISFKYVYKGSKDGRTRLELEFKNSNL